MEGTSIKFIYATSHPSANNEASSWVGTGGSFPERDLWHLPSQKPLPFFR